MIPTPTINDTLAQRHAEFDTLPEALDYAARGQTGFNFHSGKGELVKNLSYQELRDRSIGIARGLIQAGIKRGARLVILADTDPDIVTMFLACQYASVLPVPVALPATIGGRDAYITGLRRQLSGCGAVAAVATDELFPYLRSAAEGLEIGLVGTPSDFYDLPGSKVETRPFGKDDQCYLQYSSGSTRWPQGVDIPQRSLLAHCHAIARFGLEINLDDRCVSWLPLYHDMGLVGFMLTPLCTQMSVDYLTTRDFARRPLQWLSLMSRNGGSLSYSPTFGYDLAARRAGDRAIESYDLGRWRVAGVGGDMIQPDVLRRFGEAFAASGFRSTAFVPSYGLAEATLAVSFSPLNSGVRLDPVNRQRLAEAGRADPATNGNGTDVREMVFCGKPLSGLEVEVRNQHGRVVPERHIDRVFVRGPSVMAGYFGEPEATARALDGDGWLDTGDLGYMADGDLVITGRDKDLIIINGRNIWPQDLEWAVEELPQFRQGDAAAFSIDGAGEEERAVVLLQCRLRDPEARADLIRDVKGLIRGATGVEFEVKLVGPRDLPKTSSGKLSRSRARERYLAGFYDPDGGLDAAEQGRTRDLDSSLGTSPGT